MTSKQFYLALSDISDAYIEEADSAREIGRSVKRRRNVAWTIVSAAASVCALTLGIALPVYFAGNGGSQGSLGDMNGSVSEPSDPGSGDSTACPQPIYGVGSVLNDEHGSIRFADMSESALTFEIDLTSDLGYEVDYLITFYRYANENRSPIVYRLQSNDFDYGGTRLPNDLLKLYVNGELSPQNKMPDTAGHYDVVFDLENVFALYESDDFRIVEISITGFSESWYSNNFDII